MENAMNRTQRRRKLLDMMRLASASLSGGALGRETGVSRQVVVQDIALLCAMGYPIPPTARGYALNVSKHVSRFLKVCYTNEQTRDELVTIVDLGGTVVDVMVNHRVYEEVLVPFNIKNRRDVQLSMNDIRTGKSTLLMNVTSGYRFHHVCVEQEEILDEIEGTLRKKHHLAELLPYETSDDE